ncbi:hypothetical protein STA3757_18170 [Stanieria sp. NIES-3757]|nr:hypothetical protein STA3757_18170 [Stanieria sp. NIES-3757]
MEDIYRLFLFRFGLERSQLNIFGYIPGFRGAHSQVETLDELQENLREVIESLLEDENLTFETELD